MELKKTRMAMDRTSPAAQEVRLHPYLSHPGESVFRRPPQTPSTFQGRVYNFLERPSGWICFAYHFLVLLVVLASLVLSVFTSMVQFDDLMTHRVLFWVEVFLLVFLGAEYFLRLWSAGYRSKYIGVLGRLRFARKPLVIIDLIVIVTFLCVLSAGAQRQAFATSALRGIRFLQILRMVHFDRRGGTWRLLGSVIYHHRLALITTFYVGFLCLMICSYLVYLAELEEEHNMFNSYADALWWGVVTLTTIGYGDMVPITSAGKVITSFFVVFSVVFFTLPAGILGTGFALRVQQKQRRKHLNRQMPAAASLIQNAWRCFTVNKPDSVTLKVFLKGKSDESASSLSPAETTGKIKNKTKVVESDNGPTAPAYPSITFDGGWEPHTDVSAPLATAERNSYLQQPDDQEQESELHSQLPPAEALSQLTNSHRSAIKVIQKIRFHVAKRKFQQTRKPYDVQDVMEQYSHGHLNLMDRMKEVQRRLDQCLGKTSQFQMKPGRADDQSSNSIGSRLSRMEDKMVHMENLLSNMSRSLSVLCGGTSLEGRPPSDPSGGSLPSYNQL